MSDQVGAVAVGGASQGLGNARILGRRGIPLSRTWYPKDASDLAGIDASFPLAIKPAIKEHFLYATKAKAWKANSRAELLDLFERASKIVNRGEVMVQDYVPGDGSHQFAYCAFFKADRPLDGLVADGC